MEGVVESAIASLKIALVTAGRAGDSGAVWRDSRKISTTATTATLAPTTQSARFASNGALGSFNGIRRAAADRRAPFDSRSSFSRCAVLSASAMRLIGLNRALREH